MVVTDETRKVALSGQFLIVEPALVDSRGHHAVAAARFANLIGGERCTIAAGARWNGASRMAGARVLPIFRNNRLTISRHRRFGWAIGWAISIAERGAKPLVTSIRSRRQAN